MSSDTDAVLRALRELSTLLSQKQAPPDELWATAGVAPGTRLKDINSKITERRKQVSAQARSAHVAPEAEKDEEDATAGEEPKERSNDGPRRTDKQKQEAKRAGAENKSHRMAELLGE